MSRLGRIIPRATIVWAAALIFVFVLPHPFYVLRGFASLMSFGVGSTLLVMSVIALIKEQNKSQIILVLLLVIFVSYISVVKSSRWGAMAHFYLHRASYEAMAAKISAASDHAERERICGGECFLLSDDPPRISFHYSHGFLLWDDLVYDPTGALNTNDRVKLDKLASYLFGAEHITGDWYIGHFGD